MSVKGKQIQDDTITQLKLNLAEPVFEQDAATKQYTDENKAVEYHTISDKDLAAITTVNNGDLASNAAISVQPLLSSGVDVYVNGIKIPVGDGITDYAYFSPDSVVKRRIGNERLDDLLYWTGTQALYELDSLDELDYVYLVSTKDTVIEINAGDTVTFNPKETVFTFNGADGETATTILDSTDFLIGNVSGDLVFDVGNVNGLEYTFSGVIGEQYDFTFNGESYTIIYDGIGSLKYSLVLNQCAVYNGGDAGAQQTDSLDGGNALDSSQADTVDGGNASTNC
ncbi:MAG: hypothetical protein ACC656_14110 [Candidatus Heimdallarchaeota archaeon]